MKFFAHVPEDNAPGENHDLAAHLKGTGERAARFLEAIGAGEIGRLAGLLHDLGKYSAAFQKRLMGGPRVDHSTAGAREAVRLYGDAIGRVLAFPVAGHHAGLADGVRSGDRNSGDPRPLDERLTTAPGLRDDTPPLDPIWKEEIGSLLPENKPALPQFRGHPDRKGFTPAFFIRMVFSALVDADRLDTEDYFLGIKGESDLRGGHPDLATLAERLDSYLEKRIDEQVGESDPDVHALRQDVLTSARESAALAPGLFTLTVPTGGGKTLASLAFALAHAQAHGKRRVVYVIPFTSIIEQTAAVFRKALERASDEAPAVLEHHSTFDEGRLYDETSPMGRDAGRKLRLAMETWDAPVVVTTAVQFFESLYSNRPSRCRKLHNLIDAVVILDEAQTLPLAQLRPCVAALDELARHYRASIVLCTATQPALSAEDALGDEKFKGGFKDVREIAPNPDSLYQRLKRVRVENAGEVDDDTLAAQLADNDQVLCIVNTRKHARELYQRIASEPGARHLTTLMCARHRAEILEQIRRDLKSESPVRLVATSLVEAGVDVDFPVVFRALAGIDSLAQAAGRCNREGKLGSQGGRLVLFTAPGRQAPFEVRQYAAAAQGLLPRYRDPLALEAIDAYFKEVYWLRGEEKMDKTNILGRLRLAGDLKFPFASIARDFRVIESPYLPVIVPWRGPEKKQEDAVDKLTENLRRVERPGAIARKLQPYLVQIGRRERDMLIREGAAEIINEAAFGDSYVLLTNESLYSAEIGLSSDDPTFQAADKLIW